MPVVTFTDQIDPPCFAENRVAVLSWAAAIIDGEGCIGCAWSKSSDRPRPSVRSYVVVVQSERGIPLLRTMALFFGGNIVNSRIGDENDSAAYTWSMYGSKAVPFLKSITNYLVLKKEQARLVVELEELRTSELFGARPRSEGFMRRARAIVDKMHGLNWTGRTPRAVSANPTNPRKCGRPVGVKNGQGKLSISTHKAQE